MNDHLARGITNSGNILGIACTTTHFVNAMCHQHEASPTATAALGQALTGGDPELLRKNISPPPGYSAFIVSQYPVS